MIRNSKHIEFDISLEYDHDDLNFKNYATMNQNTSQKEPIMNFKKGDKNHLFVFREWFHSIRAYRIFQRK